MLFSPTDIAGAYRIDIQPSEDSRGFFARTWCVKELSEHGLDTALDQCSVSFNRKRGTVRGMHYQVPPHEENKLVRCTRGSIFDVVLDLRPDSPSFRKWQSFELTAGNHRALYIPKGCAHGLQTLEDDTEVLYMISAPYAPDASRGVRWNDPAFGITWPLKDVIVSDRDAALPLFSSR